MDEPTVGIDSNTKRDIWKLLIGKCRQGYSIIVTTHDMEEADVLADRKVILSQGLLKGCGSSSFLGKRFGRGTHLK